MDIHTPDLATTTATDPSTADPDPATSAIGHKRLMQALAATMPVDRASDPQGWAEQWDTTRGTFDALAPRDPAEAALAAFAVAALQGAMDSLARAARPAISDDTAARLRGGALAAGRVYHAIFRTLRKSQAATARATKPAAKPAPAAPLAPKDAAPGGFINPVTGQPIPHFEQFQPRDRFGNPIATWRCHDLTMAQRRATYAVPRNPEFEAIAIAEEDAAIAAQAAATAAAPPANPASPVIPANAGTQSHPT
jgi:hypothetical protein